MPTPPRGTEDDPLVQMNVRVPRSIREQVDARRAELALRPENNGHFSRDKWVTNAIRYALDTKATVTGEAGARTATPPHRRGAPRA